MSHPELKPVILRAVVAGALLLLASCRHTTSVEIVRGTPADGATSVETHGSVVIVNGVELPHRREIHLRGGTSAERFAFESSATNISLSGRSDAEYDLTAEVWEVTPGDVTVTMTGEALHGSSASRKPFLIDGLSGTLPGGMSLDLTAVSGNVEVQDFSSPHGRFHLSSNAGRIRVTHVNAAEDISVRTVSGEIDVESVSADAGLYQNKALLSLTSSSGSIRVSHVQANEVTLESVSGEIEGDSLTGQVVVCSSSAGSIRLQAVQAGSLRLQSVSGDLTLEDTDKAAAVNCESAAGKVTLRRVKTASLEVETVSGDVELEGVSAEKRDIRSTAGKVTER